MLGIAALIAIVVFTIQVYKTASGIGRNAPLWALLTAVVGFGLQIVLPILFGVVMAVYYVATGTPPDDIEGAITGPTTLIGFIGLILSIVAMYLIAKHVGKVPDDPPSVAGPQPPAPPTF